MKQPKLLPLDDPYFDVQNKKVVGRLFRTFLTLTCDDVSVFKLSASTSVTTISSASSHKLDIYYYEVKGRRVRAMESNELNQQLGKTTELTYWRSFS